MSSEQQNVSAQYEPDEILRLLRAQATLYSRLERLADKQRSLVAKDDAAPLLALLGDRQRLSSDLQKLAAHLEPIRQDWNRQHARLSLTQRREADDLLLDMRARLQRVMESDEQDARVLSGRKQAVAGILRETRASGAAMAAYRTAGPARVVERVNEAS